MEGPVSNWRVTEQAIHNQAKVRRAHAALDVAISQFKVGAEEFQSESMMAVLTALESIRTILTEGQA